MLGETTVELRTVQVNTAHLKQGASSRRTPTLLEAQNAKRVGSKAGAGKTGVAVRGPRPLCGAHGPSGDYVQEPQRIDCAEVTLCWVFGAGSRLTQARTEETVQFIH